MEICIYKGSVYFQVFVQSDLMQQIIDRAMGEVLVTEKKADGIGNQMGSDITSLLTK